LDADMPAHRAERIAEMLHRELDERLRLEAKDPRLVPISITSVEVSRDLSRAVVQFLPLGGGEVTEELQEGLDATAKRLRGPIGRALRLRHAPEIVFKVDRHTEDAIRITGLLSKMERERAAREGSEE
jgi:ribosome-binding factor A